MHLPVRSLSLTFLVLAVACGGGGGGGHSGHAFMQFREASFSGLEDAGGIVVSVVRAGNTRGVVTVDYFVAGGTATDARDYTSSAGTLVWDDGDGADKTFVIPIHEDGCAEANETVNLALANPTGRATLGSRPTATVVILDNDGIPSGSLDPAFGVGGQIVSNPSLGNDAYTTATLDGPYLYAVGWDQAPGVFDWQWRIEKRDMSTGLPVPVFGNGGAVQSNSNAGDATPFAVAAEGGYLFITGYDVDPAAGDWRWRTEKRSTLDGALDPGFGTGGALIINPSPYSETVVGLAIDGSSLYLLGDDGGPGFQDWRWRIEKRSLVDGCPDPAFGLGGVVTSDPSLMDDSPTGVVLGSSHLYVIGYDHATPGGDMQWRIEKRYLTDGSLVPTFGGGGILTSNPTGGYDIPYAAAADWDYLYIAGCDEVPLNMDWQWRIEKRSLVDGSLDPGFGMAGVIQDNPSPGDDEPWSMVIDASFMYVAGYDQAPGPGDEQWRLLKLSLQDGSPDPCFGAAGMILSNPGINGEIPWWITQDSSSLYVVGEDRTISSTDVQLRVEKRRK